MRYATVNDKGKMIGAPGNWRQACRIAVMGEDRQ